MRIRSFSALATGRRRMILRYLMSVSVMVALWCGFVVSIRSHNRWWAEQRSDMDLQRSSTTSFLSQGSSGVLAPDGSLPATIQVGPSSGTWDWFVEIRQLKPSDPINPVGLQLFRISSSVSLWGLQPLKIEYCVPDLENPVLQNLIDEYRRRGWLYELIPVSLLNQPDCLRIYHATNWPRQGETMILPSPIRPVRAWSRIARTAVATSDRRT